MGQFDALGIALAVGALLAVLLACAGMRAAWRARLRRRRAALREAPLNHAFDACAPEGADLSLEPFGARRLRGETFDDFARR